MPDTPKHRAALGGRGPVGGSAIRLEVLPEGCLLHVMGETDAAEIERLLGAIGAGGASVRKAGFQQWFIAGDQPLPPTAVAELAALLRPKAYVSDQGHGRVRIGVSGSGARDLLAKGTAVDLDAGVFPEGAAAMTLFGHVSVQLARTGPDRFELTVLRSFSESLWEELEHLAKAYQG